MGGLINVIEVAPVRNEKEKKKESVKRMSSKKYAPPRLYCDFACFHEAKIIAPFNQINEYLGTRGICIAFPPIVARLEAFNEKKNNRYFLRNKIYIIMSHVLPVRQIE